ncbi:MAG: CoA transferase [Dehalococcoidia bacterium]|nr:CoA transferase [Dehalococcoidia bacterium]
MAPALEGIRILDLSRTIPGPFCTMILADIGAEVIKVESPDDPLGMLPGQEKRAAFDFLSRNKKSIGLNLKSPEAREVFYRLVDGADVVMEAFRPGAAARLGVDYETLSHRNPALVYCSLTGFGQAGPYRDLPGHDPNYISIGGAVALTGDRNGEPVLIRAALGDIGSSLHAVIGILTALMARTRTGKGQYIDVSMTDSVLSFLTLSLLRYFMDGFVPKRGFPSLSINIWRTKDGKYVSTGLIEPHFWERFCRALGREELIPYHHAKGEKLGEVHAEIQDAFLSKTRDEWFEIMRQADTCVSPVLELDEVVNNPHFAARGMFPAYEHPSLGSVTQLGFPIKLSESPAEFRNFAPAIGQDTDGIMQRLGYNPEEIASLRQSGAVK